MLKVGLTGGIATGKTTVAEMFRARGCRVFHADRIAHELMEPGRPAYDEVVHAFGTEIVTPEGSIDRQRLAAIVFADARRRRELEQILHPRVMAEVEKEFARAAAADARAIAIVEAALLLEAGYHKQLDCLVVTWCLPEQQIQRSMKQAGLSRAEAEQRLAAQWPQEEKRRQADYEIDCSGSLEATEAQVDKVFRELRRRAEGRRTG